MSTPIVAFIVEATEHERGWGSRPDGCVIFQTEEAADAFLAKQYAGRSMSNVPDEYNSFSKMGYKEIKEEWLEKVKLDNRGYVWTNRTDKFLKGS